MRMTRHVILTIAALAALVSCSTTKLVPDGDQLFVGLTDIDYQNYVKDDHFVETQEEVEAALATKPNGALFGSSYYRTPFPYGLWIWNYAYGSHGKFKQWLNKSFGKAPVLMSQVNPALRASVAQSVLRKNGYLHGYVTYEEKPQKNPKKMKLGYTVTLDTLFTIDTLSYENFPRRMMALIDSTRSDAKAAAGLTFCVATLDAERSRVSRLFRNNGYYYYQSGFASYLADTFDVRNRAKLRLQLADSLPEEALRPWYVGNIRVNLRGDMRQQMTDSIGGGFLKVFYGTGKKRPPIRTRVIMRDMKLRHRGLFSYDDYTQSVQKLNSTGVFSTVDLQFTPRDRDTLDLTLNCTFDKPWELYMETSFVNRTIGRMGPEMKIGFTRKNAFRGGEKLDVNLHGSYEWQTSSQEANMNTYQYGADASIEFPRILIPFVKERMRREKDGRLRRPRQFYATPWTVAKVSTDIVNRPDYYKMHIVSGEWTYHWQPSEFSNHEFSPITLKYQFMNTRTERFDNLLIDNPYVMISMGDYFIPKMRYTYAFSDASKKHSPLRWEITLEESGNVMALYDALIQGHSWNRKDKTFFKNPYSQFLKVEADLTKTWNIDTKSQLVGHLNAGLLYGYGNTTDAPFSERFYVGGANSIRAFTVRSIGPGGYNPTIVAGIRQISYMLQNGDSKLVMNLEYRRRLSGSLYGAIFLDAGNVWSTSDYVLDETDYESPEEKQFCEQWNDNLADMKFKPKNLFKQLATGTGLGLRYDLDFLVIRVDWGFGLHLPYDTGKSGYFNIRKFRDMQTLHFAVGYPF